jgi:hypothetical protein
MRERKPALSLIEGGQTPEALAKLFEPLYMAERRWARRPFRSITGCAPLEP